MPSIPPVTPISYNKVWHPSVTPKNKIQQLVLNALRGNAPSTREMLKEKNLIKSVLFKVDLHLFKEARDLVQSIFGDIHATLSQNNNLDASDHFHMEMLVGDLLALIPFLRPQDGGIVPVPVLIDNQWELIPYTVEKINLTPSWMGSPLVAYGLKPSTNFPKAPPLLLFKGTTYPTDEGAALSLLTDLNPFASVGSYAFEIGKKKIANWLNANTGDNQAIVFGKSLGGALAWGTAMNFPKEVSKVMAYGAPGFTHKERSRLHKVKKQYPELELNFFCQKNDLVPYSDHAAHPGDVNYYEVSAPKVPSNGIVAHAAIYSTFDNSTVSRLSDKAIASPWKRVAVTITRLFASIFFPVILIGHIIKTAIEKAIVALEEISKKQRSAPKT